MRRAAVGSSVVGAVWAAPVVMAAPAGAQSGTDNCVGVSANGYFGWTAPGYTTSRTSPYTGSRTGAPGSGGPIDTAAGWTAHPTYSSLVGTTYSGVISGLTIDFILEGASTYLNTAADAEGHGVSPLGTSGSSWQAYRLSKDGLPDPGGNPPLGQRMTLIIRFSEAVRCPTVWLSDVDNCIRNATDQATTGCTGSLCTLGSTWRDEIMVEAWGAPNQGAPSRSVTAVVTGANLTYGSLLGGGTGWRPSQCNNVPQSGSTISDVQIRAEGLTQEIRIVYQSGINDPTGTGRQHIGLGPMTFNYTP